MAQIIIVKWQERNKEFIAALSHLQKLYDHDEGLFQFGNPQAEPASSPASFVEKARAAAEASKQSLAKKNAAAINAVDSVDMVIRMPFSAEEFSLNLESSFQSIEEMLPSSVQSLASTFSKLQRVTGGVNAGFTNLFGFQVWDKTAPVELNLEFMFNTVKSGWLDVWAPMASLCGQAILSIDVTATTTQGDDGSEVLTFKEANTYRTPGVSLPNLGFFQRAKDRQDKAKGDGASKSKTNGSSKNLPVDPNKPPPNTKVVSIEIPGLVFLETALIKSAKPTFSKEITESGAPLWGKLDLSIQSVTPANDNLIFQSAFEQIKKLKKKTVADKLEGFIKNAF
jgi:hypothetical protein